MTFFNSFKGDYSDANGNGGTKHDNESSRHERAVGSEYESFAPPPGPPPSHRTQNNASTEYAPPPGPPPGREEFAAFAGSPPSRMNNDSEPPPYHDWTVIPDTALLPPPPSIGHEIGSLSNADSAEADRAHDWCKANPIIRPHRPSGAQHGAVRNGDIRLMKPREYKGDLLMPCMGTWNASTRPGATDSCLISSAPLFFAIADAPAQGRQKKTIYFEIEIASLGRGRYNEECSVAIGYCAMPYPTWRMPGWERGSLAVHSDDGCRYVNDTWGGKDFTRPFKVGDTVGLGMTFSSPDVALAYSDASKQPASLGVDVFFTRNGQKDGSWNLHEELDADTDQGVDGLDGSFDLYAAIGVFGGAEFKAKFQRQSWLYSPR